MLFGTLATGAANVWSMVIVLVSLPLFLSGLGREQFGLWVLLQTFSAVTGWFALADLGVGIATTRRVAEHLAVDDVDGATGALDSALVVFVVVGAGAFLIVAGVGRAFFPTWFNVPEDLVGAVRTAAVVYAVQVGLEVLIEGMEAGLEGLQRVDLSRMIDSVRFTAVTAAGVVAALTTESLVAVAVASLAATVVATGLGAAVVLRHRPAAVRPAPTSAHTVELLRYGRTVWSLSATGVVHRTMDRFIVGVILGPASAALVDVATQVQNGANAVLSASSYTATSAAPWLRAREAHDRVDELLLRGTRYSVLVTMPFVVLTAVLVGPLVTIWLGAGYDEVPQLTRLALAYLLVAAPLAVGSNLLVGMGRARAVLIPAAIAVVVNLGASIVLVHEIGMPGAFVGSLVGAVVITPLLLRAVLRATTVGLGAFVRGALMPSVVPALGSAAVAATALLLPSAVSQLIVGGALGVLTYGLLAVKLSLGRDELAELRALMRRG